VIQIKRFEPKEVFTSKKKAEAYGLNLAGRGLMNTVDGITSF